VFERSRALILKTSGDWWVVCCIYPRENLMSRLGQILIAGMLAVGPATFALAQDSTTKPDNTRANQADRPKAEVTADQQKNNKLDRETTRKIRKALVSDKSLSTYAHNVRVISQNGTVTLKGSVRSEDERKTVEAKAAEIAGASNVKDELTVSSK
jgi:hypothetical protein